MHKSIMHKSTGLFLAFVACAKSTPVPDQAADTSSPPATVAAADSAVAAPEPDAAPAAPDAAAPAPDTAATDAAAPAPDATTAAAPLTQPVIAPEVGARIPPAGIMIATMTSHGSDKDPDSMVIWKLTPGGLIELHRRNDSDVGHMAWLDAHTLVTLDMRAGDGSAKVHRYRDGQPDGAPITVTRADWKSTTAAEAVLMNGLMLGPEGAIWLHECIEIAMPDGEPERCTKHAAVRIDKTPFEVVARLPEGVSEKGVVTIEDDATTLSELGSVPAPEGFDAKIVPATINEANWSAFECTAGDRTVRWPTAETPDIELGMKPDKLAWVRAKPPLVAIEGKAVNPVGWESRPTLVFRACHPEPLEAYRTLGDSIWAEYIASQSPRSESVWRLYLDDVLVGIIAASDYYFAPAPRPE